MGRYREHRTGRRLRDPSASSHSDKSPRSEVSSSSSPNPNSRSLRERDAARPKDRTTDPEHGYHRSRSFQKESYRSRSPVESRRRKGREVSEDSPAPKRRRRDSTSDHEGSSERRHRRVSPSSSKHHGDRREGYTRGRHRDVDSRSPSPPRHRRESSRHRIPPLSPRESSRSPAPQHRPRDSRSHHHQHSQRKRSRSRSPRRHRHRSPRPVAAPPKRSHAPLPSQDDAFALKSGSHPSRPPRSSDLRPSSPPPPKQAPNYAPSGLLAAETNTAANTSVVLKYHEPPSARLPSSSDQWRLYVFKGDSLLSTISLYERSCWLFGRERLVADCATEHPSCSKQHAVIQFRFTEVKNEEGDMVGGVRPYLIDLESANGTLINGEKIPEKRYVELKTKDVVAFGQSEREYVVLLPPKK